MKVRNTFIIFIISGFWHGANWTFIVWGALNAFYFLPLLLTNKNRSNLEIVGSGGSPITIRDIFNIITTFGLTVIAWVFFRAESIEHALLYLRRVFSFSLLKFPQVFPIVTLIIITIFIAIEWFGRKDKYAIESMGIHWKRPLRYTFYYALIFAVFWFAGEEQEFIYFQF